MHRARLRAALTTTVAVCGALALAACSTLGGADDTKAADDGQRADTEGGTVVLATHESFHLPKRLIRAWEAETGYDLEIRAAGDAGTLATKLSLTADNPIGDAAFGVDNTFASRPIEAGAFATYEPTLPEGAAEFSLDDGADRLTPIDNASVCVNVDTDWFARQDLDPPETLDDLTDPAYEGLFVTPGASTSSPGMAFLLATAAAYGDDWPDYWRDLLANDTLVVDGWEDAYYGDFTGGAEKGRRPIVVSYDSSPAFTVVDGRSTTAALLETCFRQVEYAGVLAGADNPAGAEALIDFLLGDEVQSALPEAMYVFPVSDTATVPDDWSRFAPQPEDPLGVAPEDIAAHREAWLTEWTDIVTR